MSIFTDALEAAKKVAIQVKRIKDIDPQDIVNIIPILENIVDKKTLAGLLAGQLSVKDDAINSGLALTRKNTNSEGVSNIIVKSMPGQQLQLDLETTKLGNVRLHCRIRDLQHNCTESVMKIELLEKKLLDKPMLSWIFSLISLGIINAIFGNVDLGEGLEVDINGNIITIDFRQRLLATHAGSFKLGGFSLTDVVVITGVKTYDGYVALQTGLNKKGKEMNSNCATSSLAE
ncbi:hypothetical protein [Pelosinus sp. sgz500959]|uniref:hypothetical protein n=1 Tax=Pelosinus sp. sgz500959 TaxID=3242472 RepID=UPI00366B7BA0